jgi:hypothetical protein
VSRKRVAVVGPARTILGTKQGASIDAHDLVVRFNDAFELLGSSEVAADVGTRADTLYCNQVILRRVLEARPATRRRLFDAFTGAGLQYVVCTNNSLSFSRDGDPSATCDPRDRAVIADFVDALARHGSGTNVRTVYAASETLTRWLQGHWARTGLVAILDLLTFDVRRLFIAGMTFYHGGGHLLAPAAAELHPRKNRDGTWAQSAAGVGHDSYLELDVMKMLAESFADVIEADEPLSALLSAPSLRSP